MPSLIYVSLSQALLYALSPPGVAGEALLGGEGEGELHKGEGEPHPVSNTRKEDPTTERHSHATRESTSLHPEHGRHGKPHNPVFEMLNEQRRLFCHERLLASDLRPLLLKGRRLDELPLQRISLYHRSILPHPPAPQTTFSSSSFHCPPQSAGHLTSGGADATPSGYGGTRPSGARHSGTHTPTPNPSPASGMGCGTGGVGGSCSTTTTQGEMTLQDWLLSHFDSLLEHAADTQSRRLSSGMALGGSSLGAMSMNETGAGSALAHSLGGEAASHHVHHPSAPPPNSNAAAIPSGRLSRSPEVSVTPAPVECLVAAVSWPPITCRMDLHQRVLEVLYLQPGSGSGGEGEGEGEGDRPLEEEQTGHSRGPMVVPFSLALAPLPALPAGPSACPSTSVSEATSLATTPPPPPSAPPLCTTSTSSRRRRPPPPAASESQSVLAPDFIRVDWTRVVAGGEEVLLSAATTTAVSPTGDIAPPWGGSSSSNNNNDSFHRLVPPTPKPTSWRADITVVAVECMDWLYPTRMAGLQVYAALCAAVLDGTLGGAGAGGSNSDPQQRRRPRKSVGVRFADNDDGGAGGVERGGARASPSPSPSSSSFSFHPHSYPHHPHHHHHTSTPDKVGSHTSSDGILRGVVRRDPTSIARRTSLGRGPGSAAVAADEEALLADLVDELVLADAGPQSGAAPLTFTVRAELWSRGKASPVRPVRLMPIHPLLQRWMEENPRNRMTMLALEPSPGLTTRVENTEESGSLLSENHPHPEVTHPHPGDAHGTDTDTAMSIVTGMRGVLRPLMALAARMPRTATELAMLRGEDGTSGFGDGDALLAALLPWLPTVRRVMAHFGESLDAVGNGMAEQMLAVAEGSTGRPLLPSPSKPLFSAVVMPAVARNAFVNAQDIPEEVPELILCYPNPKGMMTFQYDDDAFSALCKGVHHLHVEVVVYDEYQRDLLRSAVRKWCDARRSGGLPVFDWDAVQEVAAHTTVLLNTLYLLSRAPPLRSAASSRPASTTSSCSSSTTLSTTELEEGTTSLRASGASFFHGAPPHRIPPFLAAEDAVLENVFRFSPQDVLIRQLLDVYTAPFKPCRVTASSTSAAGGDSGGGHHHHHPEGEEGGNATVWMVSAPPPTFLAFTLEKMVTNSVVYLEKIAMYLHQATSKAILRYQKWSARMATPMTGS